MHDCRQYGSCNEIETLMHEGQCHHAQMREKMKLLAWQNHVQS